MRLWLYNQTYFFIKGAQARTVLTRVISRNLFGSLTRACLLS